MHVPWNANSGINNFNPCFGIILGLLFSTINIMLVMHQGNTVGRHGYIRTSIATYVV
jgi:hypothetical protein